jgi:hypothetical protein
MPSMWGSATIDQTPEQTLRLLRDAATVVESAYEIPPVKMTPWLLRREVDAIDAVLAKAEQLREVEAESLETRGMYEMELQAVEARLREVEAERDEAIAWEDRMVEVAGRNRERADAAQDEFVRFRDEVVPQVERKRHDAMAEARALREALAELLDHVEMQNCDVIGAVQSARAALAGQEAPDCVCGPDTGGEPGPVDYVCHARVHKAEGGER